MKIESFKKRLTELNITKKEFANLVGAVYNGVVNWNTKGETPKWVDSWLENYAKAKKYDFLIRLVAEHIGVKELMVLKDKD
ncbi:hypothetical protein [Helicobacter ganmani]|uniref:hypothetical protein n=1 Tax=Helicobacter ganmani TaxID=60246 RepID=UPI003A87D8F7